jgi:parallel beta-helix repeat protein
MTNVYVDPTAPSPGDGTLASPFQSWTSVTWEPGNTYLQKRGTTYSGVFKVSASGTEAQPITIAAWFNADGSDDPAQPKPVIILPGAPTLPQDGASIAAFKQERDYITYRNLDIRNPAMPDLPDVAIIWLGNHCRFENNDVSSNCGGVYIHRKTAVTVSNCRLDVVSAASTRSNHGILVAGIEAGENPGPIRVLGNRIVHGGGGAETSCGIRCESWTHGLAMRNLIIEQNRITPPDGQASSANRNAVGIYIVDGIDVPVHENSVHGMLSGIMMSGGEGCHVANNDCSRNMNFGIHITGEAKFFLIEGNTCSFNGGPDSPSFYGRGIELSSDVGQNAVAGHTIRYNTCNGNYNYGGTLDNGSEGVGIGLDDGTARCSVYGNVASYNEGNGIQLYGGNDRQRFPDTGGHVIMSNQLLENCTKSFLDRRNGGDTPSPFSAHIQLAHTYGTPTLILDNTCAGSTREAIGQGTTSKNVISLNNIFLQ